MCVCICIYIYIYIHIYRERGIYVHTCITIMYIYIERERYTYLSLRVLFQVFVQQLDEGILHDHLMPPGGQAKGRILMIEGTLLLDEGNIIIITAELPIVKCNAYGDLTTISPTILSTTTFNFKHALTFTPLAM